MTTLPLILLGAVSLFWLVGFSLLFVPELLKPWSMRGSLACAVIGGIFGCVLGWHLSLATAAERYSLMPGISVQGLSPMELEIYLDPLAGLFVLLISFFAVAIGVYSFSYLAEESSRVQIAAMFNLYLLTLLMVVIVNNVFYFLVAWELITLTSVYFVAYRHNKLLHNADKLQFPNPAYEEAVASIKMYLIASHISTVFVTISMLGLAQIAGSFSFSAFRAVIPGHTPFASWVFLLAFIGFGIKAAIFPFHVWLPYAHPTSPANIHAMMSGVMVKLAIYGMLRMFFEFLLPGEWWWGVLLLVFASATAFVGVLYAVFQSNLKTALAYHSIENIGIILAGLGLALIARAAAVSRPEILIVASLALIASLYHLINHAVFKGLLFLCTGAIERITGTVEMESLGGLCHRFPWTTAVFATGALAIAGFPPLNGFASEWLLLQSLFAGLGLTTSTVSGVAIFVVQVGSLVLLGLAFALTAFCFCKIFGTVFLGHRRRVNEQTAWAEHDVAWPMRGILVGLAFTCLILGLEPDQVVARLAPLADRLVNARPGWLAATSPSALQFALPSFSESLYRFDLQIIPIVVTGVACFCIVYLLRFGLGRGSKQIRPPEWLCGSHTDSSRRTFSEINIAFWVFSLFKGILNDPSRPLADATPVYLEDKSFLSTRMTTVEISRREINRGLAFLLSRCEAFGSRIQDGDVRTYLLYILGIVLIVFLFLIQR